MSKFLGLERVFWDYRKTLKDGKTGIYGLRRNGYWLKWDRACVIAVWGMQQLGEDFTHVLPKCFELEIPAILDSQVLNKDFGGYQRKVSETSCKFNQYRAPNSTFSDTAYNNLDGIYSLGYRRADFNSPGLAIVFKYLNDETFLRQMIIDSGITTMIEILVYKTT
ncbi:hypothetical protein AYI68_g4833 [Smittium mucronatum]|uniref:Uncharacterized protein n=1 Tax=Smittium mucronatum TaxID=133383 RepID=A0A1R0GVY1_9FUNG|nr:hypothetical protein AYI68_g4833 [Smittium mucronatum]